MSNKDDNSLGWFKSEEEKQNYINRLEKKKEARENQKTIPRIPYFIQSIVYLLGASLYQTQNTIRQGIDISWIEHFVIASLSFGLFSWLLLTGTLYLIERKKLKENKSNTALWMGIGFIAIYSFI